VTYDAHYFSPTTPTAASFDVDVSGAQRQGRIGPLSGEAELGAVGVGAAVLDDLDSTLGHSGDGILGLKQYYVNETACPVGNRRVYTGYIMDRRYYRGDSLVTGAARKIDMTLWDVNAFLSFRVFAPTADDPTSDFVRPAENDLQRVQALLTDVDFISTTLFDIGYIPVTGGVGMSAKDYTGQRPVDVLNDCAQASGRNFFVLYDETTNQLVLWYDVWTTDGTATVPYDSSLRLTNVLSEVDDVTTFAIEMNAVETLDPSRLVSAAYGEGDGVTAYRTLASTANTFAWRDMVAPVPFVKEVPKLNVLLDRYLTANATEDSRITCTVQVPSALVTAIHEGMRIQLHATHLPSVASDFTWCRILQRTVRVDVETQDFYWLDLELSPMPAAAVYMLGFLSQRSNTAYGPDIVPKGSEPEEPTTLIDPWTWVGGGYCGIDGPFDYPFDVAYHPAAPEHTNWGWGPSLDGSSKPTGHEMLIRGACGPPVVLEQLNLQTGSMVAPTAVAPADGFMFCLFNCRRGGDPLNGDYTVVSPVGVTVLADTGASADPDTDAFFPRSWLGYLPVTMGQSVSFEVTPVTADTWGCIVVFIPGGNDLEIVEFLVHGSFGGGLSWSWSTDPGTIIPGSCA
jgi:hypothetical protein